MIIRLERNFAWVEFKPTDKYLSTNYLVRGNVWPDWLVGSHFQMEESIAKYLAEGYKEVPYISSTTKMQHDPSDALAVSGNCCGGPNSWGGVLINGKSHALDCPEASKPYVQLDFAMEYSPKNPILEGTPKKCTCGSASLGSDRHSSWCDSLVVS